MTCPSCHRQMTYIRDWYDGDGVLWASYYCPYCGQHETVRLR